MRDLTLVPIGVPIGLTGAPVPPEAHFFGGGAFMIAAAPPLAGSPGGGSTAPGGGGAKPPPSGGGFGDPTFIYILLLAIGGMVLLSVFTNRKEKRRRDSLLDGLKKHDRVQTIGGVIGSVVEVKPDVVILKVDESSNTRMTFAKSAVQQILRSATDQPGDPAKS